MRKLFIVLLVFGATACGSKATLYTPSSENVNKVITASLDELNQGKDLFAAKCGQCHALPSPKSREPQKWKQVMNVMSVKAKLTPEENRLVTSYLLNH